MTILFILLMSIMTTGDCATIDLDTDASVTVLTDAGWYGDPQDGAERLYSPACR